MSNVKSKLSEKLRSLRGERSLYRVGQDSGIPRSLLQRYEDGVHLPEDEMLMRLAAFYDVDFKELKWLVFEDLFPEGSSSREMLLEWALKKQ